MRARKLGILLKALCAITILMNGVASAQQRVKPGINLYSEGNPLTPQEQAKRKAVDDAYKSTLEKLPEQKKPADPWANIRSTTRSDAKRGKQE